MAHTINRVELLGRVGSEPELRQTQSGLSVVQLRMATDRRSGSDGESQTDWHTVVCWGKRAEAVAQYVTKGKRLLVVGRLSEHRWETDGGERRSRAEVHAQEVVFLDSHGARREAVEDGDAPF